MSAQLLLYMPVLHSGYERILEKWGNHAEVLIIGDSFAEKYPTLKKEKRALRPEKVAKYLLSSGLALNCRVIELTDMPNAIGRELLILPDEEILRDLVRTYDLSERTKVRFERTFLRWDRTGSLRKHEPRYSARITLDETNRVFSRNAEERKGRSSDWWRQVGAIAVRDGEIVQSAHNEHHPTEYSPYLDGDPRNNFSRGRRIDLSTALHAEASLVAQAACEGTPLEGADLYVSTFPCPGCARLIVASGISRCFYSSGYSVLHGEEILAAGGVQVIFADLSSELPEQLSIADEMGSRTLEQR